MGVMHRAFTWLVMGALLASASRIAAQDWPVKWVKGKPLQAGQDRPILYLDMAHNGAMSVIHAVSRDGQSAGTLEGGHSPAWSPSGTWFTFRGFDQSLRVVNLHGDIKTVFDPKADSTQSLADATPGWSPDGAQLAFATEPFSPSESRATLLVINAADWSVRKKFSIPAAIAKRLFGRVRWSPDGRRILLSSDVLVAIDPETGALTRIVERRAQAVWGPRNDVIYYVTLDTLSHSALYLQRLSGGAPVLLASSQRLSGAGLGELLEMASSPSSSKLAIWGVTDSLGVVEIFDLAATPELSLEHPFKRIENSGSILDVRWAPEESALAAVVGGPGYKFTVEVYDFRTERWSTVTKVWAQGDRGAEELLMIGTPGGFLSWSQ